MVYETFYWDKNENELRSFFHKPRAAIAIAAQVTAITVIFEG